MHDIIAAWNPSGMMDDDNADWLHSLSWGGLPETGDAFMEYMSWYRLSQAEQCEAAKDFMEGPRARHMPAAVKDHLVILGLLDEEAGASMFDDGKAEEASDDR
jgi:hypothetical protein